MAKHMWTAEQPLIIVRVESALQGLTVRHIGPDELAPYDDAERLLLDVNSPDDYTRAQAR